MTINCLTMTEVLADRDNKACVNNNKIQINYLHNNLEAHDRLIYRWLDNLNKFKRDSRTIVVTRRPTLNRNEQVASKNKPSYFEEINQVSKGIANEITLSN